MSVNMNGLQKFKINLQKKIYKEAIIYLQTANAKYKSRVTRDLLLGNLKITEAGCTLISNNC